ncbi:MAG: hypothetical protein WC325_04145 [Candidatus Bathyarchaeia archaeon]
MEVVKPIIVKPSDLSKNISEISEKVIYAMMNSDEIDILGLDSAIFLACSAVNLATDIANAHINDICINYIEVPVFGRIEAVCITLGKKAKIDHERKIQEEEKDMILSLAREGQVIGVRRNANLGQLVTLCLLKLSKVNKLKIIASAGAINDAVSLALQLSNGTIAKYPIGISYMNLHTITAREDERKKITALSIYLDKGQKTKYSKRHLDLLNKAIK